jgi:hypothetical protein
MPGMKKPIRWTPLKRDKWGDRLERVCPTCDGKAFTVVKEKEREKKHRGKRAYRIVAICANKECAEHEAKPRRIGWHSKRSLKR